jgi:hypothetical protein
MAWSIESEFREDERVPATRVAGGITYAGIPGNGPVIGAELFSGPGPSSRWFELIQEVNAWSIGSAAGVEVESVGVVVDIVISWNIFDVACPVQATIK